MGLVNFRIIRVNRRESFFWILAAVVRGEKTSTALGAFERLRSFYYFYIRIINHSCSIEFITKKQIVRKIRPFSCPFRL